jgi:hypothetical protein
MQSNKSSHITHCRFSNQNPPIMQSRHSTNITNSRYLNHQPPSCSPFTLLTLPNAGIQTTTPVMQSSHSTNITHCRYSILQTPSCSPIILLTLPTVAIQTTTPHHAVQTLYSHYPPPLFNPPSPFMQFSHSTHITHYRYSNHQPPPCSTVTLLKLPTTSIQITNPHHAIHSK